MGPSVFRPLPFDNPFPFRWRPNPRPSRETRKPRLRWLGFAVRVGEAVVGVTDADMLLAPVTPGASSDEEDEPEPDAGVKAAVCLLLLLTCNLAADFRAFFILEFVGVGFGFGGRIALFVSTFL